MTVFSCFLSPLHVLFWFCPLSVGVDHRNLAQVMFRLVAMCIILPKIIDIDRRMTEPDVIILYRTRTRNREVGEVRMLVTITFTAFFTEPSRLK